MIGCNQGTGSDDEQAGLVNQPAGFEPPVLTNPEPPVAYPQNLFDEGVEGTVTLRLYVDQRGVVFPDSAMVVETSGNAQLDTAAIQGVPKMQFSPALQDGQPVAATFLQPVEFKNPDINSGDESP